MTAVDTSIAQHPASAPPRNWRILRTIRSSPIHATLLVNAIQALMLNG